MPNKSYRGLTSKEAKIILLRDGHNELPSQDKRSVLRIFLNVVMEPMLLLLLACGTIYLLIGEIRDSLMLMTFVIVVIGITFYQEKKTEKTLQALKSLSAPKATVFRDGVQVVIPGRELVIGDLIHLHEGDRIPADCVLLSCENLSSDESLLTGESIAVRKVSWDGIETVSKPGGDDLPYIYSGALIVSGHGEAKVIATGVNTEIGKIGKAIQTIKVEDTLLHKETKRIVKYFMAIGLILCAVVVAIYAFVKGDVLRGVLSGLTLSMAVLPEEFPVVLLIFLTLGAWRISKRNVLARRSAAIETLGAATTLCVDKTGTITMNEMDLSELFANGEFFNVDFTKKGEELPEKFHGLLEYSILASQKDPFDPIEKEIKKAGDVYLTGTEHIHNNWAVVREYHILKEMVALSYVWISPDKMDFVIASKGAPEAIVDLCHLSKKEREEVLMKVREMSERGLRVLGVANAMFKGGKTAAKLPKNQHDYDFKFVGLIGFVDPVRPHVAQSLREAYKAGMRVVMITGDYPGTAQFVAKEIGLKNPDRFMTGEQLNELNLQLGNRETSLYELGKLLADINIFARVVPEQKLLIVRALKANDEIVAMTGDGVNDAPTLKAAHIGVAMGERGTDVAREASALILLDDDFSSIVHAVRLGRRIFDNLRKAMGFIISIHVPIAGLSLLPVLFGLPPVFFPAHIAFLELIIDPSCSTVFEAEKEDDDIMKKPPRHLKQKMLNKSVVFLSLMQGLSVLVVSLGIYYIALQMKLSTNEARTLSFASLVFANLIMIMVNLSWNSSILKILRAKNRALKYVVIGSLVALFAVIYVPFLRELFYFEVLSFVDILIALGGAVLSLIWFEGVKLVKKLM